VATGLCAPAALWAVDVGQAGRLGQAEADLVDQSAVVAVVPVVPAVVEVDPVVPAVVEVDPVDQTVEVDPVDQSAVVEVDPVDQPQAQARQSQTEDLS
jgi:hypothetical protein